MSTILYLKRKDIDTQKWDECIVHSPNSLSYGLSWYLDAVAENWDAFMLGDYEVVMPLVWLRKFGIKCLYQPYFCQQLGLFGKDLDKETQIQFLKSASKKFKYININLNPFSAAVAGEFRLKRKKNLLLPLHKNYTSIQKQFSENHKRNIQKAEKAELIFSGKTGLKEFQNFYLQNINRKTENFKPKHEKIFRHLSEALLNNGSGLIFSVENRNGNLLAASLIVKHNHRLTNIINTSSTEGKKSRASHLLFAHLIHKYSASANVLDFEGSSIPGVARFYEGFGASEEVFYNYHYSLAVNLKQRFIQKNHH